jgi:hypothetical protein
MYTVHISDDIEKPNTGKFLRTQSHGSSIHSPAFEMTT